MPDKITEAFKSIKSSNIFLDEQDFREQLQKAPKDVFSLVKDDGLFVDYDDFETSLDLKKNASPKATSSVPSSATLSPLEIPRPQGQSEKVRVEAGATKPLPDPNKLGSFLPQDKTVSPKTDLAGAVTPAKQTAALVEERPLIKQRQEQAKQSAFENTLKAYKTKFKASETQVESERKKLEKMLNDGDLQIAKDPNTGQRILAYKNENFFSSLWDSAKRVEKHRQDNKIFSDLSLDDKIKYAEEEINKGEQYLPELPSGAMGSLGEYIAGATTPLVRPIMYGMAATAGAAMLNAPAAAAAGAQTVGSSIAFIEDMMYGNRAETFKRVYAGKLKDIPNPTEQQKKQAALEADQAAVAASAVGALEATAFSIPFGKLAKMEQSAGGYLDLVEKTAKHTMTEAPKAATIMGAGAAARGIISKEAGADLTYSDIVKESLESAKSGAELVGALGVGKVAMAALPHAMTVVAGLVRTPSKAVDSKAKAIVSELPREEVLTVYRQGEESGVYPKGTTEKVAETLKQYDEAKASVPETIEKTDTVDALTGKLEAKFKKQRELEETKVEARKKEIQAEIEALDKDIDAIYEGKPVEQHEYDITGKKISELKPVIAEEKVIEETPLTEEQLKGEPENITQPIELEPVDTSKEISDAVNDAVNDAVKAEQPTPTIEKETTTISETRPELEVKDKGVVEQNKINNRKPFTTKSGRQTVEYDENGDLIVKDKDGKEVSEKTRKKAIQEYAENFDYTVGEKAPEPTDIRFTSEEEAKRYVVENSNNPYELAELYANEEPTTAALSSKDRMIAEYGIGKVKGDSYNEFGDRNNMNLSKARTYISRDGRSLDVIAKEMSDHYGFEILPSDLIDFMDRFPSGERQALRLVETDVALEAANKFKQLTGINLNKEIAEKVVEQQFKKLTKEQQLIAEQDYETEQQLEADYWKAYEETNGFTKEIPVSETKPTETTKTLADKFKDIADIQLSDEAPTLKKRKITEYLKQNPEIAETVKNFSKATEYLEKQGRLKKSSPDCP